VLELARRHGRILVVEENVLAGGFGSAVLELLADRGAMDGLRIRRLGLPDRFIPHGPPDRLRSLVGLDTDGIAAALRELMA
jgi:1-deoxy-D-xylulose-5-phosphate synthase